MKSAVKAAATTCRSKRCYQTQYTDPTTGDVLMQARWYAPGTGTFRSRDTWAGDLNTPVTLNRYTYGANNPIRYWDPTGLLPCQNPKSDCSAEIAQLGRNYIGLPVKPTKVHETSTPIGGRAVTLEQLAETATQVNAASDELSDAQLYATVNYFSQYIGTGGAPNVLPILGEDSPQAEYFMENLVNSCGSPSSMCHEPLKAYEWELTSAGLPPVATEFFRDNLHYWIDHEDITFPLQVPGWPTTQSAFSNQLLHDNSLVAAGYVGLRSRAASTAAAQTAGFAPAPVLPPRLQASILDDAFIDPSTIRYMQSTAGFRMSNGTTLSDLSAGLRSGQISPSSIPPVRLTQINGQLFTLDHRRLIAFQHAGVPVPYRMATATEVSREAFKMTTITGGNSIQLQLFSIFRYGG